MRVMVNSRTADMRLMFKTWRFVGNTHGRWPGLDQAPRPREKVAVAGPPFVVIIMALISDAPPHAH